MFLQRPNATRPCRPKNRFFAFCCFLYACVTVQFIRFYLVSTTLFLVLFALASFFVYRLCRAVSLTRLLASLLLPTFMVLTLWSYVVHIDANFSYPYDMPSLSFFVGGLLAIYTRRFWPLVLIMFLGTLNRERPYSL